MRYLLDGYNIAHWLVRNDAVPPMQLRARLLAALQAARPKDAESIDIYWDVKRPSPAIPPNEYLGWCTMHNVPSADDAIVDAVAGAPTARGLCVVSRDREVAGRSRQLGAKILAPEQLLKR
ncbi:MAG: hypothetical protein ACT4PU_12500 [Planctomycetota bacterium]